jgi:imidazolonepropionase-like amidohydrolase
VSLSATPAGAGQTKVTVLKAQRILGAGPSSLDNGVILIRDGKIEAIGPSLPIPEDAKVIEIAEGVVTPGLIDACCTIGFEIPEVAGQQPFTEVPGSRNSVEPEPPPRDAISGRPSLWLELAKQPEPRAPNALHNHDEGDPCSATCGGGAWLEKQAAIEAAAGVNSFQSWAEQSSEVVPHCRVIDSVNLLSNDFKRLLRSGVTTVYVSPDSASVIGARGAIVKTGGPIGNRIVRDADAIKAAMGEDPSSRGRGNVLPPLYGPAPTFHTRRPTTRMGVDWVFRKAFYDAVRAQQGLPLHGADMPPPAAVPILQKVLAGEIPLRIQARMQHDICEALRLAAEFKLNPIIEEATEAYQCLPQLKAADVPVIFGPLFMSPTGWRAAAGEADDPRLNTPKQLLDAGIPFALTAQELRDEEGLLRQGMFAVRYGLPADQALKAITATPAALLGVAKELGALQAGASADLVAWTADPFDATSRAKLVMIGGEVVYEE